MENPRGTIYRLTSPEGKKYIGQTTLPAINRWKMHEHAAKLGKGCPLLGIAIRQYGMENFTREVILDCDVCDLDRYEAEYITKENTLAPHGYNIFIGKRKHVGYDLPHGVSEVKLPQRDTYGFIVHLSGKNYGFLSKRQSMDQKYAQAMECYAAVTAGKEYTRANHHKWDKETLEKLGLDLPNGIKYRKDKNGLEVHVKINGVVYRKTFTKKKFTLEENLAKAKEYLEQLRREHSAPA